MNRKRKGKGKKHNAKRRVSFHVDIDSEASWSDGEVPIFDAEENKEIAQGEWLSECVMEICMIFLCRAMSSPTATILAHWVIIGTKRYEYVPDFTLTTEYLSIWLIIVYYIIHFNFYMYYNLYIV